MIIMKTKSYQRKLRKSYRGMKRGRKSWIYLMMVVMLTQNSFVAGIAPQRALKSSGFSNTSSDNSDFNAASAPPFSANDSPDRFAPLSDSISRIRRDSPGDKLSQNVDNLQALARISSAISLEIGLIDGSIQSEAAISELLHMGNVKPKDIIDLDENVIEALDSLSQKTVKDDEKLIEDWLVSLDDIRMESGFMLNFAAFSGKNEYNYTLDAVIGIGNLNNSIRGCSKIGWGEEEKKKKKVKKVKHPSQ
uniref:WSN domain-containing protein n=1 Tax=Caenorhabditis tropicalis TaxID=1561998 RepID=A0A1I7UP57_9PELO